MSEISNGKVTEEQAAWELNCPGAVLLPRHFSGLFLPHSGSWGSTGVSQFCHRPSGCSCLPACSLDVCFWNDIQWQLHNPSPHCIRSSLHLPINASEADCSACEHCRFERISGTKTSRYSYQIESILESPMEFFKIPRFPDSLPNTPLSYAPC